MECRLSRHEWSVRPVHIKFAKTLVRCYHYSKGGSNTAAYVHGLFRNGSSECQGIAWWLPPTKSSAMATYPDDWRKVLCLTRMVILPGVPSNACSFLLARSRKMIDREKWPCLVTYADTWRGHTGAIYKADNWEDKGLTKPEPCYVLNGRMMSRKAGPKTRTRSQMEALGAIKVGAFPKHKFVRLT